MKYLKVNAINFANIKEVEVLNFKVNKIKNDCDGAIAILTFFSCCCKEKFQNLSDNISSNIEILVA